MSCLNENIAIASEGLQNLEPCLVYLVIEQGWCLSCCTCCNCLIGSTTPFTHLVCQTKGCNWDHPLTQISSGRLRLAQVILNMHSHTCVLWVKLNILLSYMLGTYFNTNPLTLHSPLMWELSTFNRTDLWEFDGEECPLDCVGWGAATFCLRRGSGVWTAGPESYDHLPVSVHPQGYRFCPPQGIFLIFIISIIIKSYVKKWISIVL